MSKDKIKQIMAAASDEERQEIGLLEKAVSVTLKAYEADFSAAKKKDWDAAKAGFAEIVAHLEQKYLSAPAAAFPTRHAALKFLQGEGYKISRGKFYQDIDKKIITISADDSVPESEVDAYITRAKLKRTKAKSGKEQDETLSAIREEERKKLEWHNKNAELEYNKKKGLLIEKKDVRTEFAIKLGMVESIFRSTIRTKSVDYITLVAGNADKKQLFIDLIYADLDDILNQACSLEDLEIEIHPQDEPA